MEKTLKSHITISSTDSNNSTFNNFMKNNNDKKKPLINDNNLENDLKKLILISLKNKKYLEKNDYFFSNKNKNKKNIKKIQLKLTPFQEYEKYKNLSMKRQLSNSELNSSQFKNPWPNININDLLTIKNCHHLKKSKSDLNQCLCKYHDNNCKKKYRTKFFISSIDNDKINNIFNSNESNNIKRSIKIEDSYDNNYIKEIRDKLCRTNNISKTIHNNIKNEKKRKLPKISKYKRYLGSRTPSFGSLKLNNINSKNRNILGNINENKKYQIPLIYLNKFQFLNEIMQNCK